MSRAKSHGLSKSAEYRAWTNMKARCNNPKEKVYPRYGGRGIMVCDAWNNSFEAFINDMGMKPSKDHTLERKDNEGNYDPDNCVWASWEEQNRNRRNSVMVTVDGVEMPLAELAEKTGINYYTLHGRIFRFGWSVEKAVSQGIGDHMVGNDHASGNRR